MDLDKALHKIGTCGRYQMFIYILCGCLGQTLYMWNLLCAVTFLPGSNPSYFCIPDEKDSLSSYLTTEEEFPALSSSHNEDKSTYTSFHNEALCPDGKLVFNLSETGRTMVTEWGLIGDDAKWVALSQTMYMTAMMVGAIFMGQLSDRFGRRPVFLLSNILLSVVGVAEALVPNVYLFGVLRFIHGFVDPGVMLTSYIFAIEIFPSKARATAGLLLSFFNAFGCVSLAAMAFFVTDWRYLQLTMTGVRIILLPLCCLVPESLQWLLSHGNVEKVEDILARMASINGAVVEYPILEPFPGIADGCVTEESDAPSPTPSVNEESEIKKGLRDSFLYDSALSLNRDYIPNDATFNSNYDDVSSVSSAEEDEVFLENQKNLLYCQYQKQSSIITPSLPIEIPQTSGYSMPGHSKAFTPPNSGIIPRNSNVFTPNSGIMPGPSYAFIPNSGVMFPGNSSLSILSEITEKDDQRPRTVDDFYSSTVGTSQFLVTPHELEAVPEEVPEKRELIRRDLQLVVTNELIKGSMSLCNLDELASLKKTPTSNLESPFSAFSSQLAERSSSESSLSKPIRKCNSAPACLPHLYRTSSLPNLKDSSEKQKTSASKHEITTLRKKHKKHHKTLHGFISHLVSTPSDTGHHMSFLSIPPALSLTNGFSQTLFPGIGLQYMNQEEQTFSNESLFDGAASHMSSVSDLGFYSDSQVSEAALMQYKQLDAEKVTFNLKAHKSYSIVDLFRTRSLRLVSVLSMFIWFSSYAISLGVSMNAGELAGNVYLNFSLMGLVDIPAVVLSVLSAVRVGRRIPTSIFHVMAFLSCLVFIVLPENVDPAIYSIVTVGSVLLTKTLISAAFNIEFLLTCELFPTPLRSVGMGVMTLASRLGGVFATFVLMLGEDSPKTPVIVFAVLSLIGSVVILPMPETKGQPQPHTVEDVKKIRKASQNSRKWSLPSMPSRKPSKDELEDAKQRAEWV